MRLLSKAAAMVGLAGNRDGDPPAYRLIAPGLMVTDTSAWAWYVIQTTNSDTASEHERDREQDRAGHAFRLLRGREWHIRGMWGSISGDEYLEGLDLDAVDEEGNLVFPEDDEEAQRIRVWAAERAEDLDYAELRTKTRLLGVKLKDREHEPARTAFGLDDKRVPLGEVRQLLTAAKQLGRELGQTVWRCRLAKTETLAWSVARELQRDTPLPAGIADKNSPYYGMIQGAPLHRLCAGHAVPMSDHIALLGTDGRPTGYAAVLALTDFPEDIETPGQEWLAVLNGLQTDASGNEAGDPVDVLAEESVRGLTPSAFLANKTVNDARTSAIEQRKSAEKSSAGEADASITLAEQEATAIGLDLKRRRTMLVQDHPRVTVSAHDRDELSAKVSAVVAAYEDMGITATLCADEQRELWLETLPCDRIRVPDLGHWREVSALTGSWFWGGSSVGSRDPRVPAIGYTTGSTQGLVRFLATEAVENSDAPITAILGRTRRGKTTAMLLAMLDVMLTPLNYKRNPWGVLMDTKGDTAGIVLACEQYGVPIEVVRIDQNVQALYGQLDGFLTSDEEHGSEVVRDQLKLLVPTGDLLQATVQFITITTAEIAQEPAPRSWKVIERLAAKAQEEDADPRLATLAQTLQAVTRNGWGALVAGKPPEGAELRELPTDTGIALITVPNLFQSLPGQEIERSDWDDRQRAAVAVLRGLIAWCTAVGSSVALRDRPKVVAVPEVHTLTGTYDGQTFLTQQARMGAANGVSMMLDSQDASGIGKMTALREAISAVFAFAQISKEEQRAVAELVGMSPDDEDTQGIVATLDEPTDGDLVDGEDVEAVRRGHCIYMDRRGKHATVQWELPSPELRDMLDTSAAAQAARRDEEAARDARAAAREDDTDAA